MSPRDLLMNLIGVSGAMMVATMMAAAWMAVGPVGDAQAQMAGTDPVVRVPGFWDRARNSRTPATTSARTHSLFLKPGSRQELHSSS